jgi:hypothetical protein
MPIVRRSMWRNPATWYLAAGLALLGGSFAVPVLAAHRTTRVESRAEEIVQLLAEAARDWPTGITAADVPVVLARFAALAARPGGPFVEDLEAIVPPLPGTLLTLRNKHYVFHLAESKPEAREIVGKDTVPCYEVMAWPESLIGPAHSAFFSADNAPAAYTRNLGAGFVGLGAERPEPGRSHMRIGPTFDTTLSYRSYDDERWIVYGKVRSSR